MLRELQTIIHKPADAMNKSAEDVVITGMGVVKNAANGTFEFPAAETAADIFLVDKERIATGIMAGYEGSLSDYYEEYITVKAGEYAKLIKYVAGERFATDQVADIETTIAGWTAGDRLAVDATGMWVKASKPSIYVFKGKYVDCGKYTMALIEVSDTAQ